MSEARTQCTECGAKFVPTPSEVGAHLAEVVDGALYEAPVGATHDALWSAFCRLAAAVDVAVARLDGLCLGCCSQRLAALDTERAARRAAGGAA